MIAEAITAGASHVAAGPFCLHAVAITPAGLMELIRSYFSINVGLPQLHGGNGEAFDFSISGLMFLERLAESAEQDDIRIVVARG